MTAEACGFADFGEALLELVALLLAQAKQGRHHGPLRADDDVRPVPPSRVAAGGQHGAEGGGARVPEVLRHVSPMRE